MGEGFTAGDGTTGAAVHDNPDHQPEASADAPRGWTWNRRMRRWQPRVRGKVIFQESGTTVVLRSPEAAGDPGPGSTAGPEAVSTQDPPPSWASDPAPPAEQWEPDDETRTDIKSLIALCYTVPAEALPMVDPFCFGPLTEKKTANGVIDAVSDIVCASPRVAKWAASKTGLMPWIKLGIALKPVGLNVLHHHVTKTVTVEVDRENRTMEITEKDWAEYPAA